MKRKEVIMKLGALMMAGAISLTPQVSAIAATSATTTNNTATANDLLNQDIIDESRSGSLTIHKYDITAAEAAGDYKAGTYKATGEADERVENALKDYGIEGVRFSLLRVGDVETHSITGPDGSQVTLVYEITPQLADILGLKRSDAIDMTSVLEAFPCDHTGVLHFTSQQISDALQDILKKDDVAAKNALENYLYDYGTLDSTTDEKPAAGVIDMEYTDKNGVSSIDGLELGLYLVVETEVPENVVSTVNPWFVQIPFTNTSSQVSQDGINYDSNGTHNGDGVTNSGNADGTDANVSGGEQWLYDMVCYPKNQTGNPTLDKSVRNAYANTTQADKNGAVDSGKDYVSAADSQALVVYNDDTNADNKADTSDAAYVANRGGYTADGVTAGKGGAGYSVDFEYRDTTTASEGDVLDYKLMSKLPHITSSATFISEYTFTDTLSKGITYNQDVKIAFYSAKEDADANNTANAALIWNLTSGDYSQKYADVTVTDPSTGKGEKTGTQMTVAMTEEGLAIINGTKKPEGTNINGLSDYYMVVFYTATVNSDASVVLGDEGNTNDVKLVWSRTADGYYNVLEDENFVYSYGIDLTKEFSDHKGKFENVQFKVYNKTDAYYLVANKAEDGLYYVTGKTTDEKKATTFTPSADGGRLLINGIEADTYSMTEVATDDGYSLLKEAIEINITPTDRDVIASVAGVTGMDADAVAKIVANYNGGIYTENGDLVTASKDELTGDAANGPKVETANGNEIGATDMYVGAIQCATATVDGVKATMAEDNGSANAEVVMNIVNSKGFLLPQTGGDGLYAVTILGMITIAGGCYLISRKRYTLDNVK